MKNNKFSIPTLIKERFDLINADAQYTVEADEQQLKETIGTVCARPEIRLLLNKVHFSVRDGLKVPFQVLDDRSVVLARDALLDLVLASIHIRHALELIIWHQILPNRHNRVLCFVKAILGLHTALIYSETLLPEEKEGAYDRFPEWMKILFACLTDISEKRDPVEVISTIDRCQQYLLALQAIDANSTGSFVDRQRILTESWKLAARALPYAVPTERILTKGGDNRLFVNQRTGLNQYGCSPKPRPWAITFSSCTASSISDIGYQEAEKLRQYLLAGVLDDTFIDRLKTEVESIRYQLISLLEIDRLPGTEVILTSSGTDSEFYALYFALGIGQKRVVNIIIGPTEVGSGTVPASGGLHFGSNTPLGVFVKPGTSVDGFPINRVAVESLQIRYDSGAVVPVEEIDYQLDLLVSKAIARGDTVLIHLLDCSKTGLQAPSPHTVRRLKQTYGSAVLAVVDVAQMRASSDRLRAYLENDFVLLTTGSKFFTGSPFSGALVIPPGVAKQIDKLAPLPAGLAGYATKYDCPERWQRLASSLPDAFNLGLLLRWRAALWEIRAFSAVPDDDRYNIFRSFSDAVLELINSNPYVEWVAMPTLNRRDSSCRQNWDQVNTIFSFIVKRLDKSSGQLIPLTYDEAKCAYRWLNMDISPYLPANCDAREREIVEKRCHIGQPVAIKQSGNAWIAALRIAPGSRLVSRVFFDQSLGKDSQERLDRQVQDVRTVLQKLSVIIRYWDEFSRLETDSEAAELTLRTVAKYLVQSCG